MIKLPIICRFKGHSWRMIYSYRWYERHLFHRVVVMYCDRCECTHREVRWAFRPEAGALSHFFGKGYHESDLAYIDNDLKEVWLPISFLPPRLNRCWCSGSTAGCDPRVQIPDI